MAPLTGVRVLDLSTVVAGPFCTMLLADMGAEVIKVERPGQGDLARELRPIIKDEQGTEVSGRFAGLNRGKKSICVDLKSNQGQDLIKELVKNCDVLVENLRPGQMRQWGLDYDNLKNEKSDLIYASISGFGSPVFGESPLMKKTAFDLVPLALSGFMDMNGEADGAPQRPGGIPLGDYLPGVFSALAIVAALRQRDKTGQGSFIDCSMYDSVLAILERPIQIYLGEGVIETRNGGRVPQPYGVFRVKDGYITIGALGTSMWQRLCKVIGRPEWIEDPRFKTQAERYKHYYATIEPEIVSWCLVRTKEEVLQVMEEHGVPAAEIRNIAEALKCPHISARKLLKEIPLSRGSTRKIKVLRTPFMMSCMADNTDPAPLLGEQTEDILRGILGYGDKEIESLFTESVIDRPRG
ncbi:CaiB/BaiF CoA transferase family protein [Paradesulfitobacterium ferrireducens]|uniref:CaiB/BaiF CoA transferase family protein n=1 Tax=Paradesulfitobacterium ferrireducens TaxID=2816476 RepID=UPI001A8EBCF4|nr:CoA transferase [Paradesulfitobacterium ferrireducens]